MNESLTVCPWRVRIDQHAVEIELDDVFRSNQRRGHGPRHEIVVRIFQRANRHVPKTIQHAFLDENSARENEVCNALLI